MSGRNMRRIADELIHGTRKRDDASATLLRERLQRAVLFSIEVGVVDIVTQTLESDWSSRRTAWAFATMPFKSCWFEFTKSDAKDAPRFGFLVEADDSLQRGTVHTFLAAPGASASPGIVSYIFDFKNRAAAGLSRAFCAGRDDVLDALFDRVFETRSRTPIIPDGAQAAEDELRAWHIIRSPFADRFWVSMAQTYQVHGIAMSSYLGEIPDFLKAEFQLARLLPDTLIALNAKNLASVTVPEDLTNVNKRRRLMGRPPLLSFSEVKLQLSRASMQRLAENASTGNMRQHIVRAHWKVRKTGIFLWSAFARGSAGNGFVLRSGYTIAGAAAVCAEQSTSLEASND